MDEQKKINLAIEGLSAGDDDVIGYTQRMRKELVDHLVGDGMPSKARDVEVLLSTLDSMSSVAATNKKIGVSEQQAGADILIGQAMQRISEQYGNKNPFMNSTKPIQIPTLDESKIPDPELVPGETEIGISTENYDTFIEKIEG